MMSSLRATWWLLASFTILLGLAYPCLVTVVSQTIFPAQANGSILYEGERAVGSALIGQSFAGRGFFWGRPSATPGGPTNASASRGSNLGPLNPELCASIGARIAALRAADLGNVEPVPADLVTASGSGLDPHITLEAALYQAGRVARARHLSPDAVRQLVEQQAEGGDLELFGPRRVNVLRLNLALEKLARTGPLHEGAAPEKLAAEKPAPENLAPGQAR